MLSRATVLNKFFPNVFHVWFSVKKHHVLEKGDNMILKLSINILWGKNSIKKFQNVQDPQKLLPAKISTPEADLVGRFDQQIFALYLLYEKFLPLVEKNLKKIKPCGKFSHF